MDEQTPRSNSQTKQPTPPKLTEAGAEPPSWILGHPSNRSANSHTEAGEFVMDVPEFTGKFLDTH